LRRELREPDSKRLIYHAFDLLYLNGSDLRPAALIDRKRALRELPATPLFLSFCCSQPGS
jgi:bifunctional non-homologous end joining protein LigD